MANASIEFRRLACCSKRELEHILVSGETPAIEGISGFEYRGYNYLPLMSVLRKRTFIKGFFVGAQGATYGYNSPVKQHGLDGAWSALPDERSPRRFGFFRVLPVEPEAPDNQYLHTLLFDYGRGGNPRYDVTRVLRDYVVRVTQGSDDLLLGKAYLALGRARLPASFFLLERHRPLQIDPTTR